MTLRARRARTLRIVQRGGRDENAFRVSHDVERGGI